MWCLTMEEFSPAHMPAARGPGTWRHSCIKATPQVIDRATTNQFVSSPKAKTNNKINDSSLTRDESFGAARHLLGPRTPQCRGPAFWSPQGKDPVRINPSSNQPQFNSGVPSKSDDSGTNQTGVDELIRGQHKEPTRQNLLVAVRELYKRTPRKLSNT